MRNECEGITPLASQRCVVAHQALVLFARILVQETERAVTDQPYHRAHVLTWLYQTGRVGALVVPDNWPGRPEWRWTVDYAADLDMAQQAFALLGDRWDSAGYAEIVALLDRHPEIVALNQQQRQKTAEEG